ncbi:MAG: cytochrome c oxidase assembly factor Coa1 family protein [Thermoguttaceae bacterium]
MDTNNNNPNASDVNSPKAQGACCSCPFGRKWFVALLVLVLLVAVVGGLVLKYGKRFSDPYKMGMARIAADKQVQASFGQPVSDVCWMPGGEVGTEEANLYWDLAGPKGKGKANVKARLMNGKWEIVMVEVTLPEGEKIVLPDKGGANDAPLFDQPKKSDSEKSQNKSSQPEPDLNISLPTAGDLKK